MNFLYVEKGDEKNLRPGDELAIDGSRVYGLRVRELQGGESMAHELAVRELAGDGSMVGVL